MKRSSAISRRVSIAAMRLAISLPSSFALLFFAAAAASLPAASARS